MKTTIKHEDYVGEFKANMQKEVKGFLGVNKFDITLYQYSTKGESRTYVVYYDSMNLATKEDIMESIIASINDSSDINLYVTTIKQDLTEKETYYFVKVAMNDDEDHSLTKRFTVERKHLVF